MMRERIKRSIKYNDLHDVCEHLHFVVMRMKHPRIIHLSECLITSSLKTFLCVLNFDYFLFKQPLTFVGSNQGNTLVSSLLYNHHLSLAALFPYSIFFPSKLIYLFLSFFACTIFLNKFLIFYFWTSFIVLFMSLWYGWQFNWILSLSYTIAICHYNKIYIFFYFIFTATQEEKINSQTSHFSSLCEKIFKMSHKYVHFRFWGIWRGFLYLYESYPTTSLAPILLFYFYMVSPLFPNPFLVYHCKRKKNLMISFDIMRRYKFCSLRKCFYNPQYGNTIWLNLLLYVISLKLL